MLQKLNKLFLLIVLLLSILPVIGLFHAGLPITHDGQDHVARIANFYLSLTEGNIFPRWAENLNWGYGHPVMEFLYPFPSYVASFFHFVGFSLVDSTKTVLALGMILSFIFMYLWLSLFSSKYASIFGAFLYTYAPYRLVDLYVRGDIGENLAFAFVPLVLFFMYRLYKRYAFYDIVLGGLSLGLLIVSHNAVSLMTLPFIISYAGFLVYISKNRKSLIINHLSLIALGFLLSAFFWIPGLLEGKYTLRNILTKGSYVGRFVSFQQLIYGPWNYGQSGQFTLQFGLLQWLSLVFAPLAAYKLFKAKDKAYIWVLGLLAICIPAIFLMLPQSEFIWSRIMLLQNFQFPWRFLTIIVLAASFISVYVFNLIPRRFQLIALVTGIMLILFLQKDYFAPKAYQQRPESFYAGVYHSTTDTGESSPIWSVRFMEHTPKAHMEIIDGKATIKELERKSTFHKYEINVVNKTLFRENTLYFPGWEIKANNVKQDIQFQNMQYRGVMLFSLDKGNYTVEVIFKATKLRLMSESLSIITFFGILVIIALRFIKKRIY